MVCAQRLEHKGQLLRKIALLGLPLVALAAAYACGGSGDNASGARGNSVNASCSSIDKLDSYRYSINVNLQSPAFSTSPSASPGAPLSAFARTLNALLSDFQVHGAHVAPDRTQTILQFQQDELELRAIGDKQWERFG